MKLLLQFIFLSVILFSACKHKHQGETKTTLLSNFVSISNNEDKGIKEIIASYGGHCEYGIEKKINADKKNKTNFWLKFSKSTSIDSLSKIAELPGSNIAYIFYKNLEKEKDDYDQIQTELAFGDGSSMKFIYTTSQLEKVKAKLKLTNKIVDLIKEKKFNDIKRYLEVDTSVFNYDKNKFILNLEKADEEFGHAKNFVMWGFKFFKVNNKQEILRISGVLLTEQNGNYFSIDLDPNSAEDKIYILDYKL